MMLRLTFALRFVALSAIMFATGRALAQDNRPTADPGSQLRYAEDVRPLLKKFCFDCHTGDKADGAFKIDQLDPKGGKKVRKSWQKAHDFLEIGFMPPKEGEQPSDEERSQLTAWMKAHPLHWECPPKIHPGRVTIRRLNRAEYDNTIRDLCGVEFHPAADFPMDDVGYGFDNIGDVLSLPPILLEKYLDAAEKITERAILVWDEASTREQRRKGVTLAGNGDSDFSLEFSQKGEYDLQVSVGADQAGNERPKLVFLLDGQELQTIEVECSNADDLKKYSVRKLVEKGKHKFTVRFPNDFYDAQEKDPKRRDRNVYVREHIVRGPIGARPEQLPDSHKLIVFAEPTKDVKPIEAASQVLKRFASRAFRRPAEESEVKRLVAIFSAAQANKETYERSIQLACQAVLVSPHFLFRVEAEPTKNDPGGIRTLNEYELAARLSYFLWSSMPDAELFSLSHKSELRKNLDAQVRRMLKDPKSKALTADFAGQWLQLRSLDVVSPGTKSFPQWNAELRDSMRTETEMFFEAILKEDRSVLEFLSADYSFLNETLAKHYGIPNVSGNEFRKVSLPLEQRGGLLGQASILTVTSNPNRTSPVKRGKWILENLLASPPPPAPPNVPALEEGRKAAESASLRKRLEMHRADPGCASCHKLLDPLGFGLENYDAIGAWRTKDGKFPVEPAGELPGGEKFTQPKELRVILSKRESDFRRCLAEKMLTYALGRGLEIDDECTVRSIADEMKKQENRMSSLILAVVKTEQFQKRASVRAAE